MSLWRVEFLEWLIKNLYVYFRRQKRLLTFRFFNRFELLESVFGNGDGWRCNRHVLNDVSFFALLHPFEETLTESWIIMLLPLATHAFIIMKTIKKMMTLSFSERCKNSSLLFHLDPFWSGDYHRSLFISQGERWSNNIWGRNGSFLLTEFLSQMDAKIFVSGHQMSLTLCWQQEKNFWIWSIVCANPLSKTEIPKTFAFQTDVK